MNQPLVEQDYGTVVSFHGYRTAYVRDVMFLMDRMDPEVQQFEQKLAESAGVQPANHSCYVLEKNGQRLYLMFTDFQVRVGCTLEIGNW